MTWQPSRGGNCEAVLATPWRRGCGRRARWQGPPTVTGGNLYRGTHKREREAEMRQRGALS